MEKRTPNDADDADPSGQHHQHHWGPVSPFARFLGLLCPPASMREVWRASPRPHRTTCACSMVLDRFLPIFPALLWLQSLSNAGNLGATGS